MRESGFSLVEALVATAILTLLVASAFDIVNPLHGTFQSQPEAADLQQRLRVATDTLSGALRAAGAGSIVGPVRGPLTRSLAPVLPYRIGESQSDAAGGIRFRADAISIVSVALTGAQATLRDAAAADATFLTLSLPPSCPPPTPTGICGFTPGTRALLYDGSGAWDAITITAAYGTVLEFARPGGLSFAYGPGSVVTEASIRSFGVRADVAGEPQLFQYDGFRADFPAVDNVVSLSFEYFGEPQPPLRLASIPLDTPAGPWTTYGPRPPPAAVDDPRDSWPAGENCVFRQADGELVPRLATLGSGQALVPLDEATLTDGPWCPDQGTAAAFDADLLRIRRVRVRLRLQVASAALRGPAGEWFLRAGRSTSAERFMPDREIVFDVAPPNMSMGR